MIGIAALTVQPLGVVLEGPLETELLPAGRKVVQVRAEDNRVGFGEFRVRPRVEARKVSGVSLLHPHGGRVVRRVVGALRYAHAYSGHKGGPAQPGQVRLEQIRLPTGHGTVLRTS